MHSNEKNIDFNQVIFSNQNLEYELNKELYMRNT